MKTKRAALKPRELSLIGWREWVSLPDLGVARLKAKIDTGARTSALHALHLEPFERDGESWLRFDLHPIQRDKKTTVRAEALQVDERWIRSSNGQRDLRPVILTTIVLGDLVWQSEITLVRRDVMGFRMLLGRQSLKKRFLIDSGHSFLCGPPKNSSNDLKGPVNS